MNDCFYRGFSYGWQDFCSWIVDARTTCVFLCVMVFIYENISGVVAFADIYGLKFTPWLLPFMANTRILDLVLWMSLLLLLCDLGSEKKFDLYIQLRMPLWTIRIGRIFSAFLRVFSFWTVVAVSPVLLFFSHIEWKARWGKVIGTLARNASEDTVGTYAIRFSATIVNRYSPLKATILCFTLSVLTGWILSIVFLIGNDICKKTVVGISISSFFVLLDFWVRTDPLACSRWIPFSFITFHNLRCISKMSRTGYITLFWAFGLCIVSIGILCVLYIFWHFFEVKYAHHKKSV